ncbi:hypothetical protein EON63_10525 [archaeon]|nr:MAG: hypothetical protein EON63_10525 [archaeon]
MVVGVGLLAVIFCGVFLAFSSASSCNASCLASCFYDAVVTNSGSCTGTTYCYGGVPQKSSTATGGVVPFCSASCVLANNAVCTKNIVGSASSCPSVYYGSKTYSLSATCEYGKTIPDACFFEAAELKVLLTSQISC